MAPRSNWKGYLKLSRVSASIAIYPATSSSEKVRFNTLNLATGNRLKLQMVDSVKGEAVPTPAAANTIVRMLKLLLNFAIDDGMTRTNPAAKLKLLRVGEW